MINIRETIGYLVGIPVVDSEHLELISIINLIHEYSKSSKTLHWVPGLIITFTRKLVEHFHSEEIILELFPDFISHKLEHKRLVEMAVDSLSDLSVISEQTVLIFEESLRKHILEYDIPTLTGDIVEFQEKKD